MSETGLPCGRCGDESEYITVMGGEPIVCGPCRAEEDEAIWVVVPPLLFSMPEGWVVGQAMPDHVSVDFVRRTLRKWADEMREVGDGLARLADDFRLSEGDAEAVAQTLSGPWELSVKLGGPGEHPTLAISGLPPTAARRLVSRHDVAEGPRL